MWSAWNDAIGREITRIYRIVHHRGPKDHGDGQGSTPRNLLCDLGVLCGSLRPAQAIS